MPSSLRTVLVPPSVPTRYVARRLASLPSRPRVCTVTPSASCSRPVNSQPKRIATFGVSSSTCTSTGSRSFWETSWYGSRGIVPSFVSAIRARYSATDG